MAENQMKSSIHVGNQEVGGAGSEVASGGVEVVAVERVDALEDAEDGVGMITCWMLLIRGALLVGH